MKGKIDVPTPASRCGEPSALCLRQRRRWLIHTACASGVAREQVQKVKQLPIVEYLTINTTYGITRDENNDSEEYVIAPNGLLDVDEAARTVFYLSLPQRVLCKDDCLGLCPVCGTDLNGFTCSCKQPERGNRLTDLKKLLDNYSEK